MTKSKLTAVLLCAALFLSFLLTVCPVAFAESTEYSDVFSDLQSDSSFDVSEYPVIDGDNSLQVIQLAESVDRDVFVYVYQPSKKTLATTVRISDSSSVDGSDMDARWYDYRLRLLNSKESLFKYKVCDIPVSEKSTRYYNIAAIHRKWMNGDAVASDSSNSVDETVFSVGQVWKVTETTDTLEYSMLTTVTELVTNKYVGFCRYPNGIFASDRYTDGHFVAFSIEHKMDRLLEASVTYAKSYCRQLYGTDSEYAEFFAPLEVQGYRLVVDHKKNAIIHNNDHFWGEVFSPPVEEHVELFYTDKASNAADGWFAHQYSWNRIQSIRDFLRSEADNLTFTNILLLSDKQWVLRFVETPYDFDEVSYCVPGQLCYPLLGEMSGIKRYDISEVSILRLKFEKDGKVYNVGVVDNKQTGPDKPFIIGKKKVDLPWWLYLIFAVVGVVLLVAICLYCPPILRFLLWIVTAPFKFIRWCVRKAKENKANRQAKAIKTKNPKGKRK